MSVAGKVVVVILAIFGMTLVVIIIYQVLFIFAAMNIESDWEDRNGEVNDPYSVEWHTPPQWTPGGAEIVFSHVGSIYVAASDGSSLRLIHGGDGDDDLNYAPNISPDGSRIAYLKYDRDWFWQDYDWEIATSALDGSSERTLTDLDGNVNSPSWSPNGARIAYVSWPTMYVMAEDGSDLAPIPSSAERPQSLYVHNYDLPSAWSPDGRRIALVGSVHVDNVGRQQAIYTVGVDGSDLRMILEDASMPAWSPEGDRMAFTVHAWDEEYQVLYVERLYTVGLVGSNPSEVTSLPRGLRWNGAVTWSPSGSEILVGPYVASVDGSELRLLPGPDGAPQLIGGDAAHAGLLSDEYSLTSWSSDGSRIAVQSDHQSVLYTVARDGSDSRVLVERNDHGSLSAVGGRPLSEGQTVRTIHPEGQ